MKSKIVFVFITSLLLVSCANNGSDDNSNQTNERSSSINQNIVSFDVACYLLENYSYATRISPITTVDGNGNKTTEHRYRQKKDRIFAFSTPTGKEMGNLMYESYYDFSEGQEPIAYLRIDGIWTKVPSPITYEEALDILIPHYSLFKKSTITERVLSYYLECSDGDWNYEFTLEVDEGMVKKIIEDGQNNMTHESYHSEITIGNFKNVGRIEYPTTEEDLYPALETINTAFRNMNSGRFDGGYSGYGGDFYYYFQKKDDGLVFRKQERGTLSPAPDYYLDIKNDGYIYEYIYDENSDGFIKQEIDTMPDGFALWVYLINLDALNLYNSLKEKDEEHDLTFVVFGANNNVVIYYGTPSSALYEHDFIQYTIKTINGLPSEYEETHGHAGASQSTTHINGRFFDVNSITVELPN